MTSAMEGKLREITERIYAEGVAKAREEADQLLSKAEKEAALMLSEARREAREILDKAREQADQLSENTQSELRLSARQLMSEVQQAIAGMLTTKLIEQPLEATLHEPGFLQQMITIALNNWRPEGHTGPDLQLLLPESDRARLSAFIAERSAALLQQGVQVHFDERIRSGFRIGPADGSYVVSFSGDDFQQLFRAYLRPQLDKLLFS
jgi:V/A-type H+-transporting ATPase subunit E